MTVAASSTTVSRVQIKIRIRIDPVTSSTRDRRHRYSTKLRNSRRLQVSNCLSSFAIGVSGFVLAPEIVVRYALEVFSASSASPWPLRDLQLRDLPIGILGCDFSRTQKRANDDTAIETFMPDDSRMSMYLPGFIYLISTRDSEACIPVDLGVSCSAFR